MTFDYETIARRIDHSLLGPTLTTAELVDGCRLALAYDVASVCIKPFAVPLAARLLANSRVAVGTTIGFPHGGHATATKLDESLRALDDGATELDMVVNIGQVLGGEWAPAQDEIAAIVDLAHSRQALVKVIFENCYLKDEHKIRLCQICGAVNADYVKTSTGYGTGGSTWPDLELMRKHSPPHVKLKAAGGIRDLAGARQAVAYGCDRFGASRTAEILDPLREELGLPPVAYAGASTAGGY